MRRKHVLLWLTAICVLLPRVLAAQDERFGITLPRALNFATSPSPIGSGARAQGQGSAFIAVADDATAASHNPGGLVQLDRPEVSIVGSYFVRLERQDVTQPDTVVEHQTLDSFDLNYLSVAIPFRLFQRSMVVAVNFQRLVDFQGVTKTITGFTIPAPTRGVGRHTVRSEQEGGLFAISPALAVQLSPSFAVGVALNIWPDILDNGWQQEAKDLQFSQQVNWELDAMDIADVIVLNFIPGSQSPITLLEFGLFAQSKKIKVCCPKSYWRSGNVHIVCGRFAIPLYHTMHDLLDNINL